jgi:predicted acetyltransferase
MKIIRPLPDHLPSYIAALQQGWSPNSMRGADASREELDTIDRDPQRYLERMVDREAAGGPVVLPDGSCTERLPGIRMWLWDGEFCGVIAFRWQPGTTALPAHVLGHVGYTIVPWKRGRGYATQALRQFLPIVKEEGLAYVELTTDPGNAASRRVIEANGGRFIEPFVKPAAYGGTPGLRYRIFFPSAEDARRER